MRMAHFKADTDDRDGTAKRRLYGTRNNPGNGIGGSGQLGKHLRQQSDRVTRLVDAQVHAAGALVPGGRPSHPWAWIVFSRSAEPHNHACAAKFGQDTRSDSARSSRECEQIEGCRGGEGGGFTVIDDGSCVIHESSRKERATTYDYFRYAVHVQPATLHTPLLSFVTWLTDDHYLCTTRTCPNRALGVQTVKRQGQVCGR